MKQDRFFQATAIAVASGSGMVIAAVDRAAPFGDDSAQFTVLLWLACSSVLGFAMPRRPWLWAVCVGPWLGMLGVVLHVVGSPAHLNPDSYSTSLIVMALSLAVCAVGAYGGALVRRVTWPPARPAEALPHART
jgi:hypothetical protein